MQQSLQSSQKSIRFSSTKKHLTTPSLLFHKSSSKDLFTNENNSSLINKSPLRQSNINDKEMRGYGKVDRIQELKEVCQSVHICENHQNKMATFCGSMDDSMQAYYCDKCAILLASQGYSVFKMTDSNLSLSQLQASRSISKSSISQKGSNSRISNQSSVNSLTRRTQINNFLAKNNQLFQHIGQKKLELKQNLIQSQQFYGQQIEQINQYFQLVYKSLQLQKNKCYNYILSQRLQVQQPVREINQMLTQLTSRLQSIMQDISQNIQTVYQTSQQIYRPVILQYQQNFNEIYHQVTSFNLIPIQLRKIDFQGVPQELFSLSQILKQSLSQTYQTNTKKMNQQLDSLRESLRDSQGVKPRRLFTKRQEHGDLVFSFQAENFWEHNYANALHN